MAEDTKSSSRLQPKRGPISMVGERGMTLGEMLRLLVPGGRRRAIARERARQND
jgi:hypothetical protein